VRIKALVERMDGDRRIHSRLEWESRHVAWPLDEHALPARCQEHHAMTLIDLSRDIYHKMPRLLNHPSIVITPYSTHDELRVADGYEFSSATMALALGDHAGTHVDAPCHFDARKGARSIDEMPLETFFTEAVCLDLAHKPLKSDISVADLQ